MKKGNSTELAVALLQVLQEYSDEDEILSMPEIQAYLEEMDITADRRSVYTAVDNLINHGFDVQYVRRKKQGYYLPHMLSAAEAMVLLTLVEESQAISKKETEILTGKIRTLVSSSVEKKLPVTAASTRKTGNDDVLNLIEKLIPAIDGNHPVSFLYYDIDPHHHKVYRREGNVYTQVPYAIVTEKGRYYCVFYNEKFKSFSNYRLDKMDRVTVSEESVLPVPFSLENHMRTSLDMYKGEAQTVTLKVKNDKSSQLFDEFGEAVIINKYEEDTFTVTIRTTLTPTLTSWLVMFRDSVTVVSPQKLVDDLKQIAEDLLNTYR